MYKSDTLQFFQKLANELMPDGFRCFLYEKKEK